MRSCYGSQWRIFQDSPDTLVRGRYYFSPPGTPFISVPTLFGSRVWDPNGTITGTEPPGTVPVVLGEVRGEPQRWDSGALPVAVPQPITVGSAECLLNGEHLEDAIGPSDYSGGIPNSCFVQPPPPNEDLEFGFSVWQCATQLFWADQITLLYGYGYSDVIANCTRRFAGSVITITKQSVLYPQWVMVLNQSYACIATAGTGNLFEALVQAIQLFAGPTDYGTFGTAKIWYDFATVLLNALESAGALDGRPILFAGHSYGGAACLVAAARLSQINPKIEVRYITYGSPKPGDERLRVLLDGRYEGLSLANDGDLVAALPPSPSVMYAMSRVGPFGFVTGWALWAYPPETALLYKNQVLKNTYQAFDSRSLVAYLSAVISTGTIGSVPAHLSQAYSGVIRQRCTEFLPTPVAIVLAWNVTKTVTSVILPPCCPSGVNQVLHVSISGCTGGSAVYNGATGNAGWSGTPWQWNVSILTVDGFMQPPLDCNAGFGWSLAISFGVWTLSGAAIGNACIPFSISGTLHGPRGTSPITFNFTN